MSDTDDLAEQRDLGRLRLSVDEAGNIQLPAEMRAAMMADGAGPLLAEIVDGELRVISPKAAIRKVRRMIAQGDWGGGSVTDQLIAERRAESLRDEAEALLPTSEW
ncbi:hypothetical protein GCM10007908_10920 [Rhizobium albus]|nr:hypothetical protein GCM10007908_10920 [Rhizobium albus]